MTKRQTARSFRESFVTIMLRILKKGLRYMMLNLFLKTFYCDRVVCIGWKRVANVDISSIEMLFKESGATERFCEVVGV